MYIHFYDVRNFYGKHKVSVLIIEKSIDDNSIYIDDKYKQVLFDFIDKEYDSIDDFKKELIEMNLDEFII